MAKRTLARPRNPSSPRFALLSVSDKRGIVDLARSLLDCGFTIVSTGGTAKALANEGILVTPIQEITKNPESFDGRMKTISFQVESGILYDRTNPKHRREAKILKIPNIELVVCNLYPFEQTIGKTMVTLKNAVESIDVGGPTMIRSSAKNFRNVLVVVNPDDYAELIKMLKKKTTPISFRRSLAAKAFSHLSFYDAQIARYLSRQQFPLEKTIPGRHELMLRYGENPHQKANVYFEPNNNSPLKNLQKVTGRELSYLNFTDIAAGLESIRIFKEPSAVVIKHNSPSGIALGKSTQEALTRAVAADPESAFGGIIVLNQPLDLATARTFADFKEDSGVMIDIVAAPSITPEATEFIKGVRKSTGIYTFGRIPTKRSNTDHVRFFDGGFVIQDWDDTITSTENWKIAGKVKPTKAQIRQMEIAWKFIGRIRSNSIIIVDRILPMTRGIGSGQTSRVRATKIALEQAGENAQGAVLASDSFFPFGDSVELAAKAGIKAIIQQGGSVNDQLSIDAADKAGIPMIFTGERKFWH